jgi:Ca2+-binding EF-hand superfamily protein
LDINEFEICLNRCGIFADKKEMKAVYKKFDKDGDGIGLNEFLCQLKEPMSDRRANMVKRCFTCMDRDGSGIITASDVKSLYNAKENPDVIQGKKTESQVLEEFLNGFDGTEGDNDGRITGKEWLDYYNELSMGIPNDD